MLWVCLDCVSDVMQHLVNSFCSDAPVVFLVHDPSDLIHTNELFLLPVLWGRILNFPPGYIIVGSNVLILKVGREPYVTHGREHLLLLAIVIFGCDFDLHRAVFSVLLLRPMVKLLLQFLFLVIGFKHGVVIFVDVTHRLFLEFQLLKLVWGSILGAELLVQGVFVIYFSQFQPWFIHVVLYYWRSWRRFLYEIWRWLVRFGRRTLFILLLVAEVVLTVLGRSLLPGVVPLRLLGLSVIDVFIVTVAIALHLLVAHYLLSLQIVIMALLLLITTCFFRGILPHCKFIIFLHLYYSFFLNISNKELEGLVWNFVDGWNTLFKKLYMNIKSHIWIKIEL